MGFSSIYLLRIFELISDELIEKVKQKDPHAERRLFDALAPRLLTVCSRYATDRSQAKDLLQYCFIKVFSKVHHFDTSKSGSFEGWFFKVSVNTILTKLRKKNKLIVLEYPEILPESRVEEEIDLTPFSDDLIMKTIQALPEKYRLVINLRIFENHSHTVIGELLGIKTVTARSHYNRAKKLLKDKLIQHKKTAYANG